MAKKRALGVGTLSVDFYGFDEVVERLNKLEADVQKIAEEALTAAHAYVTPTIEEAVQDQYLPAKGKFSTGKTRRGIIKKAKVKWSGSKATCDVGFNSKEAGRAWVFLLRGNPSKEIDQKLYDAIYSSCAEGEVRAIEKEIFIKGLKEAERK